MSNSAIVEDYESSDEARAGSPVEQNRNPYGIQLENMANREGNELPFALYSPESQGKVTWNCGYDATGRIISVFCFKDGFETDKKSTLIETKTEAIQMRDELLKNGWKLLQPPKIEFTVPDEKGGTRPLNRKEKRALERMNPAKLERMMKRK